MPFTLSTHTMMLKSFYTMFWDEVTRNLYCSKYSVVVMVMSHVFCGEAKECLLELPRYVTFILKPLLLDVIEK